MVQQVDSQILELNSIQVTDTIELEYDKGTNGIPSVEVKFVDTWRNTGGESDSS